MSAQSNVKKWINSQSENRFQSTILFIERIMKTDFDKSSNKITR